MQYAEGSVSELHGFVAILISLPSYPSAGNSPAPICVSHEHPSREKVECMVAGYTSTLVHEGVGLASQYKKEVDEVGEDGGCGCEL